MQGLAGNGQAVGPRHKAKPAVRCLRRSPVPLTLTTAFIVRTGVLLVDTGNPGWGSHPDRDETGGYRA